MYSRKIYVPVNLAWLHIPFFVGRNPVSWHDWIFKHRIKRCLFWPSTLQSHSTPSIFSGESPDPSLTTSMRTTLPPSTLLFICVLKKWVWINFPEDTKSWEREEQQPAQRMHYTSLRQSQKKFISAGGTPVGFWLQLCSLLHFYFLMFMERNPATSNPGVQYSRKVGLTFKVREKTLNKIISEPHKKRANNFSTWVSQERKCLVEREDR